jgi:hypothetical protein
MPEKKPIPVRLENELIARLDKASKRLGNNRAALIRFCVDSFLSYFENNGGVASLPPNWRELFDAQDGRRTIIHAHNSAVASGPNSQATTKNFSKHESRHVRGLPKKKKK